MLGLSDPDHSSPGNNDTKPQEESDQEEIDPNDVCPICSLLIYRPVTTSCDHNFCQSCMAQWADVSLSSQMTHVDLDERPIIETISANDIETKCPMCRTQTAANVSQQLERDLKERYPKLYATRAAEEEALSKDVTSDDSVETLTIYIGNEHRLIRTHESFSNNKHDWKFFIRPSRTDIIEEVQIFLHPTFRNPRITIQSSPYEIRRLGWGYFTIVAHVILKAGYSWMSGEAEDAPDGGENGMLPLQWTLDFSGRGAQGRCKVKIKRQKEGIDEEMQRQGERVRRIWTEQRRADPDWVELDADRS